MNEARYNLIEESTDKTFDQLYLEFRHDVDSGITYGALDTLSSILLKFNKDIEEIKQCLRTKKDKDTYQI